MLRFLHLWQANYRDVMAGSVGLIHPDALSDMLAHSPDLVTDLVAQRSAQMTATRKVRQVGMGQRTQHSMHSRLQDSWIASCLVFVALVLKRMSVDGLSPFIVLISIVQFMLTSLRSWTTLVPLLSRVVLEAAKVVAQMVEHKLVKEAVSNRHTLVRKRHGDFEETRFEDVCTSDIVKIPQGAIFPGTVLVLYNIEQGTPTPLLQVPQKHTHAR